MKDNLFSNTQKGSSRLNRNETSLNCNISNSQKALTKNNLADVHGLQAQSINSTVKSANNTGLPDNLKAGVENLSGYPMDDVKVHYNSDKPAQLQAHAYAQGNDIYLGSGQENHLPHEAWHVVQQKQGRVKPSRQTNDLGSGIKATNFLPIQRKVVSVPKGSPTSSTWKFLKSDGTLDYYDDGLPEPEVATLAPTRDKVNEMDFSTLSDIEESDTELDASTKGPHKVYRVNSLRDSAKLVHKVLRPNPNSTFGARMGGNTIFRFTGSGSQVKVQTTTDNALVQSDGTKGNGSMPSRAITDPKASGPQASYEHVLSELRLHTAPAIAQAMFNKYTKNTPYPATFSARAQAKMDEAFALLTIAEPYRSDYAFAIFVASIQALLNGASIEDAYYKGKGQIEALHAGASSHSRTGVSGQLMEQNLGNGTNAPHPSQPSMSIGPFEWQSGLRRTVELFDKASKGTTYDSMLDTHMLTPMGFSIGSRDIDSIVQIERSSAYGNAKVTVKLKHGNTLKAGDKVIYQKVNYTVNNITPTGWVNLV